MAIEVKHKFQSQKPDSPDASLIRPSNWNDTHTITMAGARIMGRSPTSAGDVQELELGFGLQFDAGSIVVKPEDFQTKANIEEALGFTPASTTALTTAVTSLNASMGQLETETDTKLATKMNNSRITVSTANPSGGSNGNVWLKV